jgi:predicted transcriptional regulator
MMKKSLMSPGDLVLSSTKRTYVYDRIVKNADSRHAFSGHHRVTAEEEARYVGVVISSMTKMRWHHNMYTMYMIDIAWVLSPDQSGWVMSEHIKKDAP